MHPVVLALELDEPLPVGVAPGDAQRMHRRLGAGIGETDLIHAGHTDDPLRYLDLQGGRPSEECAVLYRLSHLLHNRRVGMAQDDGAEAQPVVNVPVAVGVPDIGSFPSLDHQRLFVPPVAEVGVDAEGDILEGLLKQRPCFTQVA